jgi:hypothetical protein
MWSMAVLEAPWRSSSLLFLLYRPCQAFVRSTTQDFASGVHPFVPAGRIVMAKRHPD